MRGNFERLENRVVLCSNYKSAQIKLEQKFLVTLLERMAFRLAQYLTNGTDPLWKSEGDGLSVKAPRKYSEKHGQSSPKTIKGREIQPTGSSFNRNYTPLLG